MRWLFGEMSGLLSLSKLKNAQQKYKNVIVAHNMTKTEREECRKLVEKAMGTREPGSDVCCENKTEIIYDSNLKLQKPQVRKTMGWESGELGVLYTNADGSLNKREDFKKLLQSLNDLPEVIAVTEFERGTSYIVCD